jgi:hypothetical protein
MKDILDIKEATVYSTLPNIILQLADTVVSIPCGNIDMVVRKNRLGTSYGVYTDGGYMFLILATKEALLEMRVNESVPDAKFHLLR